MGVARSRLSKPDRLVSPADSSSLRGVDQESRLSVLILRHRSASDLGRSRLRFDTAKESAEYGN
jgi:hypothetical protein